MAFNLKQLGRYRGKSHSARRRHKFHQKRRNFFGRVIGMGISSLGFTNAGMNFQYKHDSKFRSDMNSLANKYGGWGANQKPN